MKPTRWITTMFMSLALVSGAVAYPLQGQSDEKHGNSDKQDKSDNQAKQARGDKHGKSQDPQSAPQAQPDRRQQDGQRQADQQQQQQRGQQGTADRQRQQQQQYEQQRPADQQRQNQDRAQQQARNQQQADQQRRDQYQVQAQPDQPPGRDKGKKTGWGNGSVPPGQQGRLSQERQQELINEQQQRVSQYRQHLDQQQNAARQYSAELQQGRRAAGYRFQQDYETRLRQQQDALQRSYSYNTDPYFYTAPSYRYNRGGSYYETNQYGAKMLRQAINLGYSEGFRSGQADRQDRWASGYRNSYAYQDANYGYNGYYGDQDSYNYYFRQGFSRGYEDGYNSRSQYGQYSGGSYSIFGGILSGILNLQSIR